MTVKFYQYSGRTDRPNKISKATLYKTVDVSDIQLIENNGVTFILDTPMPLCNLATYEYQTVTYVCAVEFLTIGNNTYQFKLTVDPLATAWERGCMDSNQLIERSNRSGVPVVFDGRLTYSTQRSSKSSAISVSGYTYVVINVLEGTMPTGSASGTFSTNPTIKSWFLSPSQAETFFTNFYALSPAKQQQYAPSIMSIYFIDSDKVPEGKLGTGGEYITLYSFNRETSVTVTVSDEEIVNYVDSFGNPVATSTNYSSNVFYKANSLNVGVGSAVNYWVRRSSSSLYVSNTTTFEATKSTANVGAIFFIHIKNVGNIQFRWSDINTSVITDIGYNATCDPVGGTYTCYLNVNGVNYRNISVTSPIPMSSPFPYDSSVTNWNNIIANNAVSMATSLVSGSIGSLVTSTINAVGDSIAAYNNEKLGSYSTVGSLGSSTDIACGIGSLAVMMWNAPTNASDYFSRYGELDGTLQTVSNLTGVVKTSNCRLPSNGLDMNIIKAAESMCDQGIYI